MVHDPAVPEIEPTATDDPEGERARFESAVDAVRVGLDELESSAAASGGDDVAEIFAAHRMFLDDPSFAGEMAAQIQSESVTAETAVAAVANRVAEEFEAIGDDYFAQRATDIRDLRNQLLRQLLGMGVAGLDHLRTPSVIVAQDLTPSETVTIPPGMALAFVTQRGSATSHTAILARSLGIPAVVGLGDQRVPAGMRVAVDGDTGEVIVEPDEATADRIRAAQASAAAARQVMEAHAAEPALSADGVQVEVVANIGNPEDASRAHEAGAEGVGLFRTEFLFIDAGHVPSEDEQYEAYRRVFEVFGSRPVVVRTLDVGGDKDVPGVDLDEELNPFLGLRGIRLTLAEEALFRSQLRALFRAGAGSNLKLMFPMVATVDEIRQAKDIVASVLVDLDAAGIDRATDFEIGIMIEVPSAAVMADVLAPHVDFFSIGTNDLTQYTLAVDRTNPKVASLADALHPAVLRLIRSVIDAAHEHGRWVGLCGELAGDPVAAPVLLGMGLDEWSMNPPSIAPVKARVRELSKAECAGVAARCLAAESPTAVRAILSAME